MVDNIVFRKQKIGRVTMKPQKKGFSSSKQTCQQQIGYKPFQIVHPPSVISKMCQQSHRLYEQGQGSQSFSLQSLLRSRRGPSIKRIAESRQAYRALKQKISSRLSQFAGNIEKLNLGEVLVWKQQILAGFLNQFLLELSKECKEKAQILLFVWNSVFHIIQYLVEILGRVNLREQKSYLNSLLDNHRNYQAVIDSLKFKMSKKQQQFHQQEEFIKALVYNLRFKRKEIKKLSKNLKMCTVRLNEFKDFYLDLQVEHIELLSQNRDISKENALNLLRRKQQINHEKTKEYRMKQSHKKIRFQIQNQIEYENEHQMQNVNKLNDQLRTTFDKYYHNKMRVKTKQSNADQCTEHIFQNALDQFNVRIDTVPEAESLIDFKNNIAFVDEATDMVDFHRDVEDVGVQLTIEDRLYDDMISHASVQTYDIKPKQKQFEQMYAQVDVNQLKNLKMARVKVLQRSYLLTDYRDKNYKMLKGVPIKIGFGVSSQFDNENNKQSKGGLTKKKGSPVSIQIQTQNLLFGDLSDIPAQMRDFFLQRQMENYISRINLYQKSKEKLFVSWKGLNAGKSKKKSKNRMNYSNDSVSIEKGIDQDASTSRLPARQSSLRQSLLNKNNLMSARNTATTHHTSVEDSRSRGILAKRNWRRKKTFESIKQNNFQNLVSKDKEDAADGEEASRSSTHLENVKKYWVMKPMTAQVFTQRKQRFLNDLSVGDKLLSKKGHQWKGESYQQNKKMVMELQKLSQKIENHNGSLDLIEQNLNQNMTILREQLKKMLNKKKNNRILPVSRQQSLCKIISFVYTYAYHLYFNHNRSIHSLIIPLFHYFKIGYGQIKKNDLYLRMLYFLSQTICHQSENYIFQNFILFLGLDMNNEHRVSIGKQTTCFHLRLLHKLSVNFRFPIDVEELYTTVCYLETKCKEILLEEKFEENIVDAIIEKVKTKLNMLAVQCDVQEQERKSLEFGETKLNVFKCCQLIVEEIEKIKKTLSDSYSELLDQFQIFGTQKYRSFVNYLLDNAYLSLNLYQDKRTKIEGEMLRIDNTDKQQKKLQILMRLMLQLNLPEFGKLYYVALSKYKIKEQFLYLSLNRRLKFLLHYIAKNQPYFLTQQSLMNSIFGQQKLEKKDSTNKKIMALAYLRVVQNQSQNLLEHLIGPDLNCLRECKAADGVGVTL